MSRQVRRWSVAAIQMNSTTDVSANVARAVDLIREAASAGAALIALPENFACLRPEGAPVEYRQDLDGELVGGMRREARRLGRYLLLGSIPERIPRSRRIYNTSVLIGPGGRILTRYRKIHLFDIDIRDGARLRESSSVAPGEETVVARTSLGKLGLSICYDLRFPELYRRLTFAGARVLFVPAAFTAFTGPDHWLPLLRARAIENQCWVVAPAQFGDHGAGRESHGETAIVDPWGEVVQRLPTGEGWALATIDFDEQDRVRRGLPCLRHARL